ncbi:MAG: hypothetical protein ACREJC_06545 [Tepidisphaeraceae bacterium]
MAFDDRPIINAVGYSEGSLITAGKSEGAAGLTVAYGAAAAAPITVVRATAYTEPTVAAQLEVVSSSANDDGAPLGTGAQTLRIVYYDGNCDGPFTTDVVMNGLTAVATTATDIRFIECMHCLTVGSNGTNVGTITLRGLGGGAVIGTIAASDGKTFWGHHYVGVGRVGQITELTAAMTLAKGTVFLRAIAVMTANAFERQITASYRLGSSATGAAATPAPFAQGSLVFPFATLYVSGPARVTAYVDPDSAVANNVAHVSFGFLDV